MTMPAGQYYVGDLCYVLRDEWTTVCDIMINGRNCLSGEFKLPDGRVFAMYGTLYGDGIYNGTNGGSYSVDSGTIGCVRLEDIPGDLEEVTTKIHSDKLGCVVEFNEPFETGRDQEGTIYFGSLWIYTGNEDEYDEYSGVWDEEYE